MELKPRLLDLYIIKKFIFTFFIALLLIIGIVIIFDISEKIDDFVSNEAPLKAIIFDYYLNFIPYFMNMFSPLFVFITVIFFTSKMASNSEIVAILSCGISFHRMMVPYIISAAFIALFSLGLNLFVIPKSNEIRVKFEEKYIKGHNKTTVRDIHYQISPGEFVFVESFSSWNNTAYRFTLEKVRDNRLVSKLSAETAVWDSTRGCWNLRKYFIRDYSTALEDHIRSGASLDTVIDLSVNDLYIQKGAVETLSYERLNELISIQKMRGDENVKVALIEKHTPLFKEAAGRHRMEYRHRHRIEFLIHSLPEIQPDVRLHGFPSAGHCPVGAEHPFRDNCRLPVQDSAEITGTALKAISQPLE